MKKQKKQRRNYPEFFDIALQGITYWMGHRRCFYKQHPLTEGALVAEICNLIFSNMEKSEFKLQCEKQYKCLTGQEAGGNKTRADLVIFKIDNKANELAYIIEVKRGDAKIEDVFSDLKRLALARKKLPTVRTFLFLVSEASRPKKFVSESGKALAKPRAIKKSKMYYKVQKVCKAAHAFDHRDKAQYACLIESFFEKPKDSGSSTKRAILGQR